MDDDFDYDGDDAYHDDSSDDATAPSETAEAAAEEEDAAEGSDGAETYVPQSIPDDDDGDATYVPRAFTEAEDDAEELCDDEKTIALDELAQVASICLTHPPMIRTIGTLLRRQASRRIGWQEDRKTKRLFGRWLGEFVDKIVGTRSPVELFDLLASSIRPCSASLVEVWRAELDKLRNDDGSCDEWGEFDE